MQLDIKGREIKPGDLIRVPHFRARLRRQLIYMYKLVDMRTILNRTRLYAVDVGDIYNQGSIEAAHKCPLSVIDKCEIIDGGSVDGKDLFWERPNLALAPETISG
jgi:hypothetical protein